MAKFDVETEPARQTAGSLGDELDRVQEGLHRRGRLLASHRDLFRGDAIQEWLTAERDLARQPVIEVRHENDDVVMVADLADVDPGALDVEVTADHFVVTSRTPRGKQVYLSIQTPVPVDPARARVTCERGVLVVRAKLTHGEPAAVHLHPAV